MRAGAARRSPALVIAACCLSLAWVALAPGVHAATPVLTVPGITGEDNRVISDSRRYPWSAVGRLNITTGGFCSATVIGPRRVLTAAHCLWNRRTARWFPACALHFLAGYQRGEYAVHALVAKIDIVSGYDMQRPRIDRDWAVVTLDRDVAAKTGVVDIGAVDTPARHPLIQAGYSRDRPHVLTVDSNCRQVGAADGGRVMLHNCDATFGDSGSPILRRVGDGVELIGLHVALRGKGERATGVAVASRVFRDWIAAHPVDVPPGGVKACAVEQPAPADMLAAQAYATGR